MNHLENVSSTAVRAALANNDWDEAAHALHPEVAAYIKLHALYS